MIGHYDWAGGREAMMRFGPDTGPVVILALPLFEEANRTRTFAVGLLRRLGERGIGGVLPDLPGMGESLTPLVDTTLLGMSEAFEAAAGHFDRLGRQTFAVSIRGGTLVDGLALVSGRWHLSPVTGEELLRELVRTKNAEASGHRHDVETIAYGNQAIEIAGSSFSTGMMACLKAYVPYDCPPVPRRTARLDSDPKPSDVSFPAAPLWRRTEPDDDPVLAAALADDIAEWIATCGG